MLKRSKTGSKLMREREAHKCLHQFPGRACRRTGISGLVYSPTNEIFGLPNLWPKTSLYRMFRTAICREYRSLKSIKDETYVPLFGGKEYITAYVYRIKSERCTFVTYITGFYCVVEFLNFLYIAPTTTTSPARELSRAD